MEIIDLKDLEGALKRISAGRVLDVATGQGQSIKSIQESFADYDYIVGIDRKTSNLEKAKESFNDPRIEFIEMDAHNLEFDSESFDTVFISNSLHHMDEPSTVLDEMIRVLKPSGTLVVNEMHCSDVDERQMTHVLLHHWWADIDQQTKISHYETFSHERLVTTLKRLPVQNLNIAHFNDQSDVMNDEMREWLDETIDSYTERARTNLLSDAVIEKGAAIRRRVSEIGLAWAPCILAVATK